MARKASMSDFVAVTAKTKGTIPMTMQECRESQYGMPLHHFVLQYLFSSSGVRFGGVYMIQGPPASNKSALLFYLLSCMCKRAEDGGFDGGANLSELESKVSFTMLESFMNKDYLVAGDLSPFKFYPESTLESCLKSFQLFIKQYREKIPSLDMPLAWGIDSVGGAATDEGVTHLETDGAQGRGFNSKPLTLKNFFENYSAATEGIPAILYCVNHEKPKMSGGAFDRGVATGGESQKFKASLNFKVSAMDLQNKMGKKITIVTYKNSFGWERKAFVDFTWKKPTVDDPKQYHEFDFAKASVDILVAPPTQVDKEELEKIIHVTYASDGKRVNCPELGISMGTPDDFEAALQAAPDILTKLFHIYAIDKIQTFDEYLDLMEEKKKAARAKSKKEKGKDKDGAEENDVEADEEAPKPKGKAAAKAAQVKAIPIPTPIPMPGATPPAPEPADPGTGLFGGQ